MKEMILTLEKRLFQHEYIKDRAWLAEIIHVRFQECGKSGRIYDKKCVVTSLSNSGEDRNIRIYNYECTAIDANTYLIHYITKDSNALYYRTSIWVMENHLKLLFHQASRFHDEVELTLF